MTYEVGQKLWYQPSERWHGLPRHVTITKVGRKWLTLDDRERCDIETLVVDGGIHSSPGRCWDNKDECEAEQERERLWRKLQEGLRYKHAAPDGIRACDIEQALRLLRLWDNDWRSATPPPASTTGAEDT